MIVQLNLHQITFEHFTEDRLQIGYLHLKHQLFVEDFSFVMLKLTDEFQSGRLILDISLLCFSNLPNG